MPSPFKNWLSLYFGTWYVSVGRAAAGDGVLLSFILLSTFSCAMTAAIGGMATGGNVTATMGELAGSSASFALPPIWSGSALVLMMKRMGFGGPGELIIAARDGLPQPYGLDGQWRPTHLLVLGEAVTAFERPNTVSRTLSLI